MPAFEWQAFSYIVEQVETPLIATVSRVIDAFLAYAEGPLRWSLILYMALTALLLWRGETNEPLSTLLWRVAKACVVVWVLTSADVYQYYVHDFFFTILPTSLTNALTASGAADAVGASGFDSVWLRAWRGGLDVWRTLGWDDISEKLVIVVFWMAAILSTGVCFAIWLVSRLLLALSIAVGPLLVGLILFPATRSVFERWVGFMISCVLLQVLTVVLLSIVLTVEGEVVGRVASLGSVDPMAKLQVLLVGVLFFAVAGFVALQLPGMATALAGGLYFHTGALARKAREAVAGAGHTYLAAGRAVPSIESRGRAIGQAAAQRLRPPTGGSLSDGKGP